MGMFDDITCERPLPGPVKPPNQSFQTKDFDCYLDHYMITAEGTLVKDGAPIPFHGLLNFYTYTRDDWWFEYEAKFTDGQLVDINPVSIYQQPDNGPGKTRERIVVYPTPDSAGDEHGASV